MVELVERARAAEAREAAVVRVGTAEEGGAGEGRRGALCPSQGCGGEGRRRRCVYGEGIRRGKSLGKNRAAHRCFYGSIFCSGWGCPSSLLRGRFMGAEREGGGDHARREGWVPPPTFLFTNVAGESGGCCAVGLVVDVAFWDSWAQGGGGNHGS